MSHMVIFQTPDGNPGYNQFETVDAAVAFVEKLRNEQNVLNSRIFKLEELKYDFKPYYKVTLQMLNSGAPTTPSTPSSPSAPAAATPAPAPTAAAPTVNGDAAAPAPPVGAPISNIDSPVGRPAPTGGPLGGAPGAPPAPGAPAAPTASAPEPEPEPARRGLFGR